ncbi:tartronate semialdehyde reductase [Citrobacter freundii]|nr:tartronate semialdehyde reductase [Citrobacter freundii]
MNPDLVYQAIRGGLAGSTVLDAKAPMVMDRNFKPGFRIDLHIKDLANALDTSHGVGAQLPLTAAVMEMMQALRADGLGTADHSALACYYEKTGESGSHTLTRRARMCALYFLPCAAQSGYITMKIVIAPDSYKESLSATEVAQAIEKGFREIFPDAQYVSVPVADGGEGTVEAHDCRHARE